MIPRTSTLRSLSRHDGALLLEAAPLVSVVWAGLRLLPFRTLRHLLGRYASSRRAGGPEAGDTLAIARVRWAVRAVARRLPGATCLVQALAAEALLLRRGIPCELRFGVRRRGHSPAPVEGHAWVECGGQVAIGALDDLAAFQPLTPRRSASGSAG